MSAIIAALLNPHIKPLCPRDNHVMKFEGSHSRRNYEHQAAYHCGYDGSSVRYDTEAGYYTILCMDDNVYRLEEPGVNTLKCPIHAGWLYRQANGEPEPGARWHCGVEGCEYSFDARTKGDWVRT